MTNSSPHSASIAATIGDVRESQIAIGEHILQVNARAGAIVKVMAPRRRPRPKPRAGPLQVRPRPLPGFVGRSVETDTALSALRDSATVEIIGDAGYGKTALLRHLCHTSIGELFPDGILHLVAAGRPAEDLLQLVYGHFYEAPGRYKPTEPELRHALLGKRALIVLDDVDLARADLLTLLDALPDCAVLVGAESRRLWGESQIIPLAGLPAEHAVLLFERELGRALDPEERPVIESLCVGLDGHPLRILQAAARSKQSGTPLLGTAAAPAPELDDEQRSVLLVLVAAGALELGMLLDLTATPNAERAVDSLIELRLVEAQDGALRSVARAAELFDASELDAARRRLLAYLVTWAEMRRHDTAAIAATAPLLLRALHAALTAGDAAAALRLGRAIEGALMLLGMWGAWRLVLDACARAGRALADAGGVEAWVLHQLGTLDIVRGDLANAATRLEGALRIRESLGDAAGAAATRGNLLALRPPPAALERLREWTGSEAGRKVVAGLGVAAVGGAALFWQFVVWEPPAELDASPELIDFAEQEVGTESVPREIRITNASRGLVRLEPAAIDGDDFSITADDCAGTLPGEASCTIVAAFSPTAPGYRTGRLRLRGERAHERSPITLAGYGIDPPRADTAMPPPPPDTVRATVVAVTAQDVDFGEREVGSLVVGTGVLTNTGTVALRFGRLDLSGDADFRLLEDGCSGGTLAAGARCQVHVEFRPAASGARSATIVAAAPDGTVLSMLRIRGGGEATAPPPPPARILRFAASPASIEAGGTARLCYALAEAVEAEIRPPPDAGEVTAQPQQCVSVRPTSTLTYTLRVIGLDGGAVERQATVTVTQPDRQPPPPPQRLTPGSTQAANPQAASTCPRVVASWTRVTDPSAPVEYEVVLQHQRDRAWRALHRARTRTTSADFGDPLGAAMQGGGEGSHVFRWTVRAIDAAGNIGEFAPMRYFSCIVIL
jgi:hypothetical protein